MNNIETIIGVEVHAELNTKRKIFSPAINNINSSPNTNIHPIDLAFPGTLPRFNEEVLQKSLMIVKALNMDVTKEMHWDRKNYFYHDNPKGYQITQFDTPIGREGFIELDNGKKIGIAFMHMEEDTAKTFNDGNKIKLDYNRAGVPLVEIVSHPVLRSGSETREYLEKLREILVFLGVSDGKLEEGSFRVDVNISIRPAGSKELRTKVEIKNLNSFANVEKAINLETQIQTKKFVLDEEVLQATKRFDEDTKKLVTMRLKEGVNDYRYFPEPDLPEILLSDEYIEKYTANLPMLPQKIRRLLIDEYKLPEKEVNILLSNNDMTMFFMEATHNPELDPKQILNYLLVNVNEYLNKNNMEFKDAYLTVQNFVDIRKLLNEGKISTNHVKQIIPLLIPESEDVQQLVKKLGIEQISDPEVIRQMVQDVLAENEDSIVAYKEGKKKAFGFLIGKVIATSRGQANPKLVNEILSEELNKGE